MPWIKCKIVNSAVKGGRFLKAGTPELLCWVRRGVQGGSALPRKGVTISLVPDLDLGPRSVFPGMCPNRQAASLSVYEYGTWFTRIWPK